MGAIVEQQANGLDVGVTRGRHTGCFAVSLTKEFVCSHDAVALLFD